MFVMHLHSSFEEQRAWENDEKEQRERERDRKSKRPVRCKEVKLGTTCEQR
jgi:hypothetical protein